MMNNYDQSIKINHNPNWTYILHYLHRTLIIGGSGSDKTNVLLYLIKKSTTRYVQNLFICQRSIRIKESIAYQWKGKVGIKKFKNKKAFINYSQTNDIVYENLEDYNTTKKRKVLIVFEDMRTNMESNKN